MKKRVPSKAETELLEPFVGLPLERIHVPANRQQFIAATTEILAQVVVGFDTESKPTFRVGEISDGPHIVQFALPTQAFIFQLHQADCREFLVRILLATSLTKVGFGLKSDHGQIHAKLGVALNAVLDLNDVFRRDGYSGDMGARAAVGVALNRRFNKNKSITTTNWALPELTSKQLLYAANDAYAALKVFEALDRSVESLSIA